MPRFSFPVPGRRQKQAPASVVSPPRNKAQKILGSSNINVDSSHAVPTSLSADAHAAWDTRSSSCISISVSDSSASQDEHNGAGLSGLTEGHTAHRTTPHNHAFEEESSVLPRDPDALGVSHVFGLGEDATAKFHPQNSLSVTDTSSLRRQHSSSTITSFYDKSKMPLVISQQTSSSAMAKGLPAKASCLLDMDGTISNASKSKKKQSRLDLAHLIPKRISYGGVVSPLALKAKHLPKQDVSTRSPPTRAVPTYPVSVSPASHRKPPGPSAGRYQSERKLQRPHSRHSSKDMPTYHQSPTRAAPPRRPNTGGNEEIGLKHLYQHYERMSARDALARERSQHAAAAETAAPTPREQNSAHAQHEFRSAPSINEMPTCWEDSDVFDTRQPSPAPSSQLLNSSAAGYADSVSSRHTRTSKASRRTSQSLLDVDLQQNSVLSLSSDSEEDDMVDPRPHTSVSASAVTHEASSGNSVAPSPDRHRPLSSRSYSTSTRGSRYGAPNHAGPFLAVPESETSRSSALLSVANSRDSSMSFSSNSTAKPNKNIARSSSRASKTSMSSNFTTNSFGQAGYSVHEARAVTVVPAHGPSFKSTPQVDSRRSSNQPTPPLSPMNGDFHETGLDVDQRSLLSSHSFGTASSTRSGAGPSAPGRFIAVTRQEEKLLAALRTRRARMQESIIAEFEEDEEMNLELMSGRYSPYLSQESHSPLTASMSSVLELHAPQPQSTKLTSFKDLQLSADDDSSIHPTAASTGPYGSRGSDSGASSTRFARRRDASRAAIAASIHETHGIGRESVGESSAGPYSAEPSPDLSDFMEFDDEGSGSSGSFPFQTPVIRSPIGARPASMFHSQHQVSHRTQPRSRAETYGSHSEDDVHVHIVDEPVGVMTDESEPGVPRPDSPVETRLPLPRKKAVRLSAVGTVGMEVGWWGDDG